MTIHTFTDNKGDNLEEFEGVSGMDIQFYLIID